MQDVAVSDADKTADRLVELVAAHEIGAETVTYVSNIYKYYVAYKMVAEENQQKKRKDF